VAVLIDTEFSSNIITNFANWQNQC